MAGIQETFTGLFPLLAGLALWALAFFVLKVGRGKVHNRFFAALYTLSGVKSLAEAVLPRALEFHEAAPLFPEPIFWFHVIFVAALFMLPFLVLFLLYFPRPARLMVQRPQLGVLLFLPSIALTFVFFLRPYGVSTGTLGAILNALASLATFFALLYLWRTYRTTPDPIEHRRAGYLLLGFSPAFAGTWLVTGLFLLQWYAHVAAPAVLLRVLIQFVLPILELGAAAITAFAILKYQMLGIELQVKVGLRYAITMALIVGSLVTVNEFLGEFFFEKLFGFSDLYWLFGGVAGVLAFRPVERGALWLTDRMFPDTTKPRVTYAQQRARELYHAQATYVLRDAHVTPRELRVLRALRRQLDLSGAEARRIEDEVRRNLGQRTVAARPRATTRAPPRRQRGRRRTTA